MNKKLNEVSVKSFSKTNVSQKFHQDCKINIAIPINEENQKSITILSKTSTANDNYNSRQNFKYLDVLN